MATDEQAKREFYEKILVRSGKKAKSVINNELDALRGKCLNAHQVLGL
jgi:hypothetical protein